MNKIYRNNFTGFSPPILTIIILQTICLYSTIQLIKAERNVCSRHYA